jgi:hypothetical protein
MIKKYVKKPVVIEAIKFIGSNHRETSKFVNAPISYGIGTDNTVSELIITTLEGNMTANIGDYIIKGVKGEFYPCKPDIFEMTYHEVLSGEQI